MLNKSFSAKLRKSHKGGWTYVVWQNSVKSLGTRGLVKVRGWSSLQKFVHGYETRQAHAACKGRDSPNNRRASRRNREGGLERRIRTSTKTAHSHTDKLANFCAWPESHLIGIDYELDHAPAVGVPRQSRSRSVLPGQENQAPQSNPPGRSFAVSTKNASHA